MVTAPKIAAPPIYRNVSRCNAGSRRDLRTTPPESPSRGSARVPGWGQARYRRGEGYQPIGVPMAGIDKSTARAIAVIALLFVGAWALRGYLPGIERVADRGRPTSSSAALVVDVALLTISVAIIGVAIITRLRNRQARRPGAGQLPESPGTMGRPTWRFSLIALGLVIGWLVLVLVLMRM